MTLALVSSGWLYIAPDRSIMSCGPVSAVAAPGSVSCWFVWSPAAVKTRPMSCCHARRVTAAASQRHVVTRRHTAAACNTTSWPPPPSQPPAAAAAAFRHRQSISQQLSRPRRQSYALRHASTIMIIYVYEKYLSMTHKIFI